MVRYAKNDSAENQTNEKCLRGEKKMPTSEIVEYCAPTLAGIKTGSLFSIRNNDRNYVVQRLRKLNHLMRQYGLRIVPLKYAKDYTLIYVYRPKYLDKDLHDPRAIDILNENGYSDKNADLCVCHLVKRLKDSADFPHEIGLFLGYPPEDVKGFINNPNVGVKYVGCWKVYGDKKNALMRFKLINKCTEIYKEKVRCGIPLEELMVKT